MKDKETPPIVFTYEERIAELEKENEQLKRINTLLEESNNFYAYKDNWDYGTIDIEDTVLERGGKLARETAKQIEKIRSE